MLFPMECKGLSASWIEQMDGNNTLNIVFSVIW